MAEFLITTIAQLRKVRSKLGNLKRHGKATGGDMSRLNDTNQFLKDHKYAIKHAPWQKMYDQEYAAAKAEYLANDLPEKSARYKAHLKAQNAVAAKFEVTVRGVRKAIITGE